MHTCKVSSVNGVMPDPSYYKTTNGANKQPVTPNFLGMCSNSVVVCHFLLWLYEQCLLCLTISFSLSVSLSTSYRQCRKDEIVLCHAPIGHTHRTHSYILKKDPPPQCEHCQWILTVRYILVECNHFAQERKDIFGRRNVVELFRFHLTLILLFLKQTEFYCTF